MGIKKVAWNKVGGKISMALSVSTSNAGKRLVQVETGRVYDEAVDPALAGRTYTESSEDVPAIVVEAAK